MRNLLPERFRLITDIETVTRKGAALSLVDTPTNVQDTTVRIADWDPIRGNHHGQRSPAPRKQAGHKTAPDHHANTLNHSLQRGSHPHRTFQARP